MAKTFFVLRQTRKMISMLQDCVTVVDCKGRGSDGHFADPRASIEISVRIGASFAKSCCLYPAPRGFRCRSTFHASLFASVTDARLPARVLLSRADKETGTAFNDDCRVGGFLSLPAPRESYYDLLDVRIMWWEWPTVHSDPRPIVRKLVPCQLGVIATNCMLQMSWAVGGSSTWDESHCSRPLSVQSR